MLGYPGGMLNCPFLVKSLPGGGGASPDLPAAGVSIEVKRTGHRLRSSSIHGPKTMQTKNKIHWITKNKTSASRIVFRTCFVDDSDITELSDAYLSNSFDLDFCYAAMLLLALVVVDLVTARGESPVLSAKLQH